VYSQGMTAPRPMPAAPAPGYCRIMTSTALPPLTRRMSLRDLVAVDSAVGALVCGLALLTWFEGHEPVVEIPDPVRVLLIVVLGAAIGARRLCPWAALWAVSLGAPVMSLESQAFPWAVPPAMMLVLYTLAAAVPRRQAVRALGIMLGCSVAMLVVLDVGLGRWAADPAQAPHEIRAAVFAVTLLALPLTGVWMIGVAVGASRAYTAGLQAQAEQRAREQVVEERLRIARELHDIVAHSMSLITVQASVAGFVGREQPDEAVKALASIEQTGRTALHDMRRLLGMLRAGDGRQQGPELLPAPGLTDLDDLVARTAESGIRVELKVSGERIETSTPLELAVYRIVQEALTNVIKHADATRARVVLDYGGDAIGIIVVDDGRGAPAGVEAGAGAGTGTAAAVKPGHGLVGMHERVAAYGGEFQAGPLPGGGFRVVARIPLEAAR